MATYDLLQVIALLFCKDDYYRFPKHNAKFTLLINIRSLHNRGNFAVLLKKKNKSDYLQLFSNNFAPRALHLSPRQDREDRCRKPKTARYAGFKNTNYNVPRNKTMSNRKFN